ncbi:MAG: hypothetical protein ACM3OB_01475 [Acidobacteriota bacterium]
MRRRALVLLFLVVPLLAVAEHAWRSSAGVWRRPTGRAEWIWARGGWWRHAAPSTLWAGRDFEVSGGPRRACLVVQADEEYVAFLNGRRVGSGRIDGGPADSYEVGSLLRDGGNRLVIELHSERGSGGMLAALDVDGVPAVWSDGSWRMLHELSAAQLSGLEPLGGERAVSWGLPPVGRWPVPRPGAIRPAGWQMGGGAWLPGARRKIEVGSTREGLRVEATLFEWAQPVRGFLRLRVRPDPGRGATLLFYGDTPPDTAHRRADEAVMAPPGSAVWRAAVERSFRYVTVLGEADALAAWVEPAAAGTTVAPAAVERGVFGLPPPLGAPMQDEIRRELEGFPRIPGREEG